MLLLLLACSTPDDSPDSAGLDTARDDTGSGPNSADLAESHLVVDGAASSASGFSLAFGPDTDNDGSSSAWIAGYFTHEVCRFEGQAGTLGLLDAQTCIHSSHADYPGYGLGVGADWVGLGAIGGNSAGTYTGTVYLLPADLPPGTYEVDAAPYVLEGEAAGDYAGTALAWLEAGAGEETFVVGAPGNDTNGAGSGRVYVYSEGLPEGGGALVEAPTIVQGNTAAAAVRHGAPEAGDGAGSVVASAGDVNGDGLDDLILGCNGADDGGDNAGLAAIFEAPLPPGVLALRDADAVILGVVEGALVGDTAVGLGDTNGDGLGDVAVAGEMAENGRTWLFTGPVASGTTGNATASFVGESQGDNAGASVGAPGDTDGNGLADLLIGALQNNRASPAAGAAYLVFAPFAAGTHSLAEADATWLGTAEGDALGRTVAGGGDYNGDGLGDVLLGAPYSDAGGAFSGAAYVIVGR